ncbi:YesL family protein [Halobacillus dabanensis]|nr:DUF624 domain-containing protein [Halobacillus dabanensis]
MGWKNGLAYVSSIIMKLAAINLLWLFFIVVGAVVFGVFPSTIAMFAVMRKWMKGNLGSSLIKEFWFFYKKEFWRTNGAGAGFVLIGYILYVDLFIYQFGEDQQILQLLLYILSAFYCMAAAYFFPLYVHHEFKWYQYLKVAILTSFSAPFRGLLMLFLAYGIYFLMSKSPGLYLFFFGSGIAYLWLMITLPTFQKLLNQNKKPRNKKTAIQGRMKWWSET